MHTKSVNLYQKNPANHGSALLSDSLFEKIIKHTPLIAIDLIVQDSARNHLLGLRKNPPAQGYWFVPGGRIRKNETLEQAFHRISTDELGLACDLDQSIFLGVFEHFYDENFLGTPNEHTHYLVLAYRLWTDVQQLALPTDQHARYRWANSASILQDLTVHPYSRAYFLSEN